MYIFRSRKGHFIWQFLFWACYAIFFKWQLLFVKIMLIIEFSSTIWSLLRIRKIHFISQIHGVLVEHLDARSTRSYSGPISSRHLSSGLYQVEHIGWISTPSKSLFIAGLLAPISRRSSKSAQISMQHRWNTKMQSSNLD